MDIKFDAGVAEVLIQQMDRYCSGIQRETIELLAIMNDPGEWQDNQMSAFQANINELAEDLNRALSFESEYLRTYHQRVLELRG